MLLFPKETNDPLTSSIPLPAVLLAFIVMDPPSVGIAVGVAVLLLAKIPPEVSEYKPPPIPLEIIEIFPVDKVLALVD
jgi:hypothetical protein